MVMAPLYRIQRQHRDDAEAALQQARIARETAEARKTELTRRFAREDDEIERASIRAEIAELDTALAELGEPIKPRLLADDATPEVLASLLTKHPQIAVISDESAAIDNFVGRYSEKGKANLHLACKAYTASPVTIDRRDREEIIERPLLSITLFAQPLVLATVVGHGVARGQGLVGRFAYSIPRSLVGHRDPQEPPRVPAVLRDRWDQIVSGLYTRISLTKSTETPSGRENGLSVNSVNETDVGIL